MTQERRYTAVVRSAEVWWRGKRPLLWTKRMHLNNPKVNCVTTREHRLAASVAAMLKSRRT